ncbi:hypothetical protein PBY51_002423 [Eleginops maclovinus]|uniref:Uncharacterized protein n=1 Tax=Eleginops maclovinus TaxID=56733 RepID=A0AAN7XCL5_ELEMC|nr:hypothetical protein PBY51_002423 [Eleginops maclovinus]
MLPRPSDAGRALCSSRALSRPGCPGSSAGKACPFIPSPVLTVHPGGPRGGSLRRRMSEQHTSEKGLM